MWKVEGVRKELTELFFRTIQQEVTKLCTYKTYPETNTNANRKKKRVNEKEKKKEKEKSQIRSLFAAVSKEDMQNFSFHKVKNNLIFSPNVISQICF